MSNMDKTVAEAADKFKLPPEKWREYNHGKGRGTRCASVKSRPGFKKRKK